MFLVKNVPRVLRATSLLLFDPVELMSFLNDYEKDLFQLFSALCVLFETFIWSKGTPVVFIADFGLGESSFAS